MNTTSKLAAATAIALVAVGLSGCAGMTRGEDTVTGAVVGGVAGAALTGSPIGAVGGAAVGGVVGNQVGKDNDRGH
jgi:osmotically inducible lipoprotein OsmB